MTDTQKLTHAIHLLLEAIGEDPTRPGLVDTPARVARMFDELTCGTDEDAAIHLATTFSAVDNEMVIEKDIVFHSICEHHIMPFFGRVHIAYIPDGRVVGLSKLARTVETYARRLQLQEQLTTQIAEAIMTHLAPKGVMVMIEAEHLCMTMRGVKKPGTQTVTVITKGTFTDDDRLQNTFFRMLGR
jgi:GTP cyclohydrolase I